MEACTRTMLRSLVLLGMLVLSTAAAAAPSPAPHHQESDVFPSTSTITCAEKCAISCALSIFSPPKYAACVGLCMTACKIGPTSSSDVAYACTRGCANTVSNVIATTTKPSIFGIARYVDGYVDSCYQSCSKNEKLYA